MKTQLFPSLAIAAALLTGTPAFAFDHNNGGRGGGSQVSASVVRGGERSVSAFHAPRGVSFASGRSLSAPFRSFDFSRGSGRSFSSSPTVAFGGNNRNFTSGNRGFSSGRGGRAQFAFSSHSGWDRGRSYDWRGHHYRYFDNAWFIVDPYPYYADYPYYGDYDDYGPTQYYSYQNYDNSDESVGVQVQSQLRTEGYYRGPIDGIVGPGTSAAIAAFQRDNGLHVTGTINTRLLGALGVG